MKRVGLMLTKAQISRLSKAAGLTSLTVSDIMRQLIDYHLVDVVNKSLDTNLVPNQIFIGGTQPEDETVTK